jgi:hypothetical protein
VPRLALPPRGTPTESTYLHRVKGDAETFFFLFDLTSIETFFLMNIRKRYSISRKSSCVLHIGYYLPNEMRSDYCVIRVERPFAVSLQEKDSITIRFYCHVESTFVRLIQETVFRFTCITNM